MDEKKKYQVVVTFADDTQKVYEYDWASEARTMQEWSQVWLKRGVCNRVVYQVVVSQVVDEGY